VAWADRVADWDFVIDVIMHACLCKTSW
jgi:hypothetical protein